MNNAGLLHIYAGDGKGKTSAAIGLCIRAKGAGMRVLFAQFLKGKPTCELAPMKQLGITIIREEANSKFMFQMDENELREYKEAQRNCFFSVKSLALSGSFDLIVLDEILDAVHCGIITDDEFIDFAVNRPKQLELVLTGRNPSAKIVALADYFSEIHAKKHPYQNGVPARRGIEF